MGVRMNFSRYTTARSEHIGGSPNHSRMILLEKWRQQLIREAGGGS